MNLSFMLNDRLGASAVRMEVSIDLAYFHNNAKPPRLENRQFSNKRGH